MGTTTFDKRLYEIRPWRVVADILRAWVVTLLAIGVGLSTSYPVVLVCAILVIGTQQYALQIILHDGLHGRLMPTRRRTDLICRLILCYPLFTALLGFRKKHLDHHQHLGTANDPDRYYHVTLGKHTRIAFLLFLSGVWSSIATLLGGVRKTRVAPTSISRASRAASEVRANVLDWLMVAVVQAALVFGFVAAGGAVYYLLLWVLPFGFGVFIMQNVRSFAEHAQPEPDELADTHREVTFISNPLERLFLAPMNMNYHAEHHKFPGVPYYHLPAVRRFLEARGDMDGVEYRRSYLGFLLRYWLALPIATTVGPGTARSGLAAEIPAGYSAQ